MLTLGTLLARAAAEAGDRPAIADSRSTVSWRDLARLAEGYAAQLGIAGIGRGERVAFYLHNSADYLALIFAAARLGAVAVHINPRFRAHELGSLLRRTAPAVLVTETAGTDEFAALLPSVAAADRAALRLVLLRNARAAPPSIAGIPVAPLHASGTVPDASLPDDPCAIFTTTGSTGEPKLVLHGQRQLAEHFVHMARAIGLDRPDAVVLANVPFCGMFGFSFALAAAAARATLALPDSADTDALIRRHRVTHAGGFADALARVLHLARSRPYDTAPRFIFGPSALVDNEAVRRQAEALGMTLLNAYGSTEGLTAFALSPKPWGTTSAHIPIHPEARFVIRDSETGQDLPDGEAGALLIASPSLFLGYVDGVTATSAARTDDGFFRTGDRAYRQGNGFVFLGRLDETVRLGNVLVDPAEIEAFLRTRPEIAMARVVGAAGRIIAFVVPRAGQTVNEAELLEDCRDRMASFKVPTRVVALDAFPVSEGANGTKIRVGVLHEMAKAALANTNSRVPSPASGRG